MFAPAAAFGPIEGLVVVADPDPHGQRTIGGDPCAIVDEVARDLRAFVEQIVAVQFDPPVVRSHTRREVVCSQFRSDGVNRVLCSGTSLVQL